MIEFSGKTALITGAGSGIGKATAELFHQLGAKVLLADINASAAAEAAKVLDPTGKTASAFGYDAADRASADNTVAACIEAFGGLDYLVAAAGIYRKQSIAEMTDEQWREMMGVNLDGIFYITRAAIPHFSEGGAIVNLASIAANFGGRLTRGHYGASKGGVMAYTRGLAKELAPKVRVNCLNPGIVETPMADDPADLLSPEVLEMVPLKRPAQPSEMASIIAFLCSDAASYITAEAVIASGGFYIG
ncbi:SDR family oxidoreductase [Rhodobacteraceae bacterium D3-12]|nr:SDR family oxidoreductase [Rhodobacteraceae bacterium D3-12]